MEKEILKSYFSPVVRLLSLEAEDALCGSIQGGLENMDPVDFNWED